MDNTGNMNKRVTPNHLKKILKFLIGTVIKNTMLFDLRTKFRETYLLTGLK